MIFNRALIGVIRFIPNKKRHHFGSRHYFGVLVEDQGTLVPLLLTHRQMMTAMKRAKKNPEDLEFLSAKESKNDSR